MRFQEKKNIIMVPSIEIRVVILSFPAYIGRVRLS